MVDASIVVDLATAADDWTAAADLLARRYRWRGYANPGLPRMSRRQRVLIARRADELVGTMTVFLDGPRGLNGDHTFVDELAQLRVEGRQICEFGRLAVDPTADPARVLAALFHAGQLIAEHAAADTLLMEVHPRHVRYYCRMLCAHPVGPERTSGAVNAPARLLMMALPDIRHRIDGSGAGARRSLYSMAFRPREEAELVARLTKPR